MKRSLEAEKKSSQLIPAFLHPKKRVRMTSKKQFIGLFLFFLRETGRYFQHFFQGVKVPIWSNFHQQKKGRSPWGQNLLKNARFENLVLWHFTGYDYSKTFILSLQFLEISRKMKRCQFDLIFTSRKILVVNSPFIT